MQLLPSPPSAPIAASPEGAACRHSTLKTIAGFPCALPGSPRLKPTYRALPPTLSHSRTTLLPVTARTTGLSPVMAFGLLPALSVTSGPLPDTAPPWSRTVPSARGQGLPSFLFLPTSHRLLQPEASTFKKFPLSLLQSAQLISEK